MLHRAIMCLSLTIIMNQHSAHAGNDDEVTSILRGLATLATTFGPTIAPFALTYNGAETTSDAFTPTKKERIEDFFKSSFAELKKQVAKGSGEELDAFAKLIMSNENEQKAFKHELRKRQFKKTFTNGKEKGWKHVNWVIENKVHIRKIYASLYQLEGAESSPLIQLIKDKINDPTSLTHITIKHDKGLSDRMERYTNDPNDHEVDARIYKKLKEYATRTRSKRLLSLLPYTVK